MISCFPIFPPEIYVVGKIVSDQNASLLEHSDQGLYGPQHQKTCLWRFANITGADQPVHPRSLISAFVINILKNSIGTLATGEIQIF